MRKPKVQPPLETYTEFQISVKGPKGDYAHLRRVVQRFEELLRLGIAAYLCVAKQSDPEKRIVITIQ